MRTFFLIAFVCLLCMAEVQAQEINKSVKKWFIVFPLRFTHLQNTNTILSGVKIGRTLNKRFGVSLSVYHSFYINSMKPEADINEFDEQPRMFINALGVELDFKLMEKQKFSLCAEVLIGWGFMKYDLEENNFTSSSVHYLAFEPAVVSYYKIQKHVAIGAGIGYRPVVGDASFSFSSDHWNGSYPVHRNFPNGLNFLVSLKGYL